MPTPTELRGRSVESLEELYRAAPMGPTPRGRFRGEVLARLDNRLVQSRVGSLIMAPFERGPFGIDFASGTWFYLRPWLRVGRFRLDPGPSSWRDAEVLRLDYGVSRLPGFVRNRLYDEVKPLSETLCLGLGGIKLGERGGAMFFFALTALGA